MAKKVVSIPLTPDGINQMIREINEYRKRIEKGQKELLKKLADTGAEKAQERFSGALYAGRNDVFVRTEETGENKRAVVADSNQEDPVELFIEFGTGVVWADNHPEAAEHGMVRGEYGHKLGRREKWRYKGDPGNLGNVIEEGKHKGEVETSGNPAAKAMYHSRKTVEEEFSNIAREVFKR